MGEFRTILEGAYSRFQDLLETNETPAYSLYSYDICDTIREAEWPMAGAWAVPSELQEAINGMNAWRIRLHNWGVWVVQKAERSEEDWWQIQHHFLEPLVFYCMHQPSAFSDRLFEMAEFSVHQANLAVDKGYKDRLGQDDLKRGKRLSKEKKMEQLTNMAERWNAFQHFAQSWGQINSKDYRSETRNFRNLASHSFAPRFTNGQIMRVTREIGPWQNMEQQADGTYRLVDEPNKKAICYSFGALNPLDLSELHKVNLLEQERVSSALDAYSELLKEISLSLPAS